MISVNKKIKSIQGDLHIIETLKSGPVSTIYLTSFNGIKSVTRIDLPLVEALKLDRKNEAVIIKSISHLELAPKILYQDDEEGILIWKYIEGEEVGLSGSISEILLQKLGESINSLHKSDIPKSAVDIFKDSMIFYKESLKDFAEKDFFKKGFDLYDEICRDEMEYVFSHNDLNRANILWRNKYYFLDWEYSSLNHPYFDIASIVDSLRLSESEINILWAGYCQDNSNIDFKKLNQWIKFLEYLEIFWKKSLSA